VMVEWETVEQRRLLFCRKRDAVGLAFPADCSVVSLIAVAA
jgi:hypothetical protein